MNRIMKESKAPWTKQIPEDWETIRNKFILIGSYSGGTPKSTDDKFYSDKGLPFISIADMSTVDFVKTTNSCVTSAGIKDKNLKIVPAGSVIYSMYATVGHVAETEIDATISQAIIALFINETYDKSFYKYNLQALRDYIFSSAEGTTQMNLNAQKVYEIYLMQPPLSEQKSIVAYLDAKCSAIDESINRHKQIINKLEEYKRAYIIFAVDGIRNNRPLKSSDIAWMPQVPENWEILPLRYVFGERKNINIGVIEKNLLTLSYGKIKRKDINTNEGLLPKSFEGYNIVEKGDIVLRLLDLQNDWNSLRTGLVTERGIVTSAYVTLYPLKKLNSEYFRYLLHSYDLKKVFYTMGEGIRQSLKYDDIARGLLLPIPSMEEQEEIVNAIKVVESKADASIARHQQIIEKLEEYRKSIIYNAVTGKIDCRKENVKNGI